MKEPESAPRFVNPRARLPYGITPEDITAAIDSVYEYWHEVNEWHIENGHGRFHEQFRANNAIGGFVSNRLTRGLVEQHDDLELNPADDGYPDIHYTGDNAEYYPNGKLEWPDDYPVKDKEGEIPGIEVKGARSKSNKFHAHHNVEGWLLGGHYSINARGDNPENVSPIELTQVVIASMEYEDWEERPSGEDSNRTNTSDLPAEGMHELRKNPVYESVDGIPRTQNADWNTLYKRIHALFDEEYRAKKPWLLPQADGSNVCADCGGLFKNERGVSSHKPNCRKV